jgi:Ca2+-transporting ATPase
MTVVNAMFLDENYDGKEPKQIVEKITSASPSAVRVLALAAKSLNVNSTACEITDKDGKLFMQGSKTEIAILDFFTKMGYPFEKDRQETEMLNVVPFSSAAKRMSCKVAETVDKDLFEALGIDSPEKSSNGKFPFVFVKGASEIVLRTCNRIMTNTGKIVPLTEEKKREYEKCIVQYADGALRTICCGIKPVYSPSDESADLNETTDLVLVGIFGILDPLRPEVSDAVASCKEAGIVVRMVTGDSMATAKAIARGCGILDSDGLVMEGPDFRKLSESELNNVLPKLQVLARSSPLDKQILVRNLKRLGETVAVTGGTLRQKYD